MAKKRTKMNSGSLVFRQGDVLIMRDDSVVPDAAKKCDRDNGRIVLAYGEVTGHAHAIASDHATLYAREPNLNDPEIERVWRAAERVLVVDKSVSLSHEEHATIELPPGTFLVRRQREYEPQELRLVAD